MGKAKSVIVYFCLTYIFKIMKKLQVFLFVLIFFSVSVASAQTPEELAKGVNLIETQTYSPDELVENSKFKNFPGFTEGIAKEGYIGLQDHGYTVWFRNIKIREL